MSEQVCPEWCTLPADHDERELLDGGRVHYAPTPKTLHMSFDDHPQAGERGGGWYLEVLGTDHQHATAGELAAGLRMTAADLTAAAEWLEGHQ